MLEALRCRFDFRDEASDAQSDECCLELAPPPSCSDPAAAQPAEKAAFEELGIEAVGLCTAMFARYRNTRSMNDAYLDAIAHRPVRPPKAVMPCFKCNGGSRDLGAPLFDASRRQRLSSVINARSSVVAISFTASARCGGQSPPTSRARLIHRPASSPYPAARGFGSGHLLACVCHWEAPSVRSSQRRVLAPRCSPHSILTPASTVIVVVGHDIHSVPLFPRGMGGPWPCGLRSRPSRRQALAGDRSRRARKAGVSAPSG